MRHVKAGVWSAIVFLLVLSGTTYVASAQEFTVRAGTVAPEGTPWSKLLTDIAKRIETESNGRIKFKLYFGGKLGGEDSLVRRAQNGTLEMVGVSTGAMTGVVPELDTLELPYLFDNYRQIDHILDNVVNEEFRRLLSAKGFYLYVWSENGWRNIATKDRFVKSTADLAGLKIRSQPNPVHVDMWQAWGANAVPIAVPEVPSSLQNGVVSGYDNTLLFGYAAQWHQAIKKVTVTEHIYQPAVVVFNKQWYDKLPQDLKDIINRNIAEDTKSGRHAIRKLTKHLVKQYQTAGVEFYQHSAEEKREFATKARVVWDKFRTRTASGSKLLDKILEAKKQVN